VKWAHGLHAETQEDALMRFLWLVLVVLSSLSLSACEVIGDIFQAGVWVGAIIVVLVIAIVGFLAAKLRG
jgi:uncharacterized membrane protein YkvI